MFCYGLKPLRSLGALFVMAAATCWSSGWVSAQQVIIEGEEPYPYGVQPREGETQEELNQRLLKNFGNQPYGRPDANATRDMDELNHQIREKAEAELREKQVARAERRARWALENRIEAAAPSRRSLILDRARKNQQLTRDLLEIKLRSGEINVAELEAAAMGLYDDELVYGINAPPIFGTPNFIGSTGNSGRFGRRGGGGGGTFRLEQQGGVDAEMLENYSQFMRAERLYDAYYE